MFIIKPESLDLIVLQFISLSESFLISLLLFFLKFRQQSYMHLKSCLSLKVKGSLQTCSQVHKYTNAVTNVLFNTFKNTKHCKQAGSTSNRSPFLRNTGSETQRLCSPQFAVGGPEKDQYVSKFFGLKENFGKI